MKHNISITIPGKTFIGGEYLALQGGGALIFASKPHFQLNLSGGGLASLFHPDSPAGKVLSKHKDFFSGISLDFVDSYQLTPGFGASTAQFLALQVFLQIKDSLDLDAEKDLDLNLLLNKYWDLFSEQKIKPSGADLVGQFCGGMTYFEKNSGHVKTFAWPFTNLHLSLISTGKKLATHQHLSDLKEIVPDQFKSAMQKIIDGLSYVSDVEFIDGINAYGMELEKQNLVAEHTQEILSQLRQDKNILACKGCGAMGADVVLAISKAPLQSNYRVVATQDSLSSGVRISRGVVT